MKVSKKCLEFIKAREGCRLTAYVCPAGVLTIGYGHTGPDVKKGLKITAEQAEALLLADLAVFEKGVLRLLGSVPTQGQFDALVSFAFNLGLQALAGSTLLKKFKVGNTSGAADQFLKWVYADGKVLPGLQKRREAERLMFLGLPYSVE